MQRCCSSRWLHSKSTACTAWCTASPTRELSARCARCRLQGRCRSVFDTIAVVLLVNNCCSHIYAMSIHVHLGNNNNQH